MVPHTESNRGPMIMYLEANDIKIEDVMLELQKRKK